MKPKAIIVDIDGTLANNEHRRHFIDASLNKEYVLRHHDFDDHPRRDYLHIETEALFKADWKSYNEAMDKDTPNEWCVEIIEAFVDSAYSHVGCDEYWHDPNKITFLFVSGRECKFSKITDTQIKSWTSIDDCKLNYSLFMRSDGDSRPDVEIKREIYENQIKDKYDVLFCLDDRKCVVDLWRSLGLICLDCAGYEG